jgi:hypothetical protein
MDGTANGSDTVGELAEASRKVHIFRNDLALLIFRPILGGSESKNLSDHSVSNSLCDSQLFKE